MMECTGFDDLTGEANLNQLDENQNLDFKKEADIICKVIESIKLGQQTNQNHTDEITQRAKVLTLERLCHVKKS